MKILVKVFFFAVLSFAPFCVVAQGIKAAPPTGAAAAAAAQSASGGMDSTKIRPLSGPIPGAYNGTPSGDLVPCVDQSGNIVRPRRTVVECSAGFTGSLTYQQDWLCVNGVGAGSWQPQPAPGYIASGACVPVCPVVANYVTPIGNDIRYQAMTTPADFNAQAAPFAGVQVTDYVSLTWVAKLQRSQTGQLCAPTEPPPQDYCWNIAGDQVPVPTNYDWDSVTMLCTCQVAACLCSAGYNFVFQ